MRVAIILFVVFVAFQGCLARRFERCELARTLKAHGFPQHELADWVCLVESESGSNTAAVGPPNTDGSHDYGLFQINSRYWCNNGFWWVKGGGCNINCSRFLDDDITDDVICVRRIFRRHWFHGWYGWINKCQGRKPDLSYCGV